MKIIFHRFRMGDVEDPELYAAQPIWEWEQTEQGQWVIEHVHEPRFFINTDPDQWGYQVDIVGEIKPGPKLTEYLLKWQNVKES